MKKFILLLLTILLFFLHGCSSMSYDSVIAGLDSDDPEHIYKILKEPFELEDEEEAVRLQALRVHYSLKTQSEPFREAAKKLLDLVGESTIDLSTADYAVQTYVYLAALSYNNKTYNRQIDSKIIATIDELCIPSNKLARIINDAEDLVDIYYQYHLGQACQALFLDRPTAKDVKLAMDIKKEDCSSFSSQTSRAFISRILECRLEKEGINITDILTNTEE